MLATLHDEPFSDPGWVFERKLDGVRVLAFRRGRRVRLLTRNRKRRESSYPEVVEALAGRGVPDVVLDGVTSKRASLESVSGNLEYTGSIAPSGRYNFSAHSGDVVLTIGDSVGFELEASTFSGEIESEFTLKDTSRVKKGRQISAVVGDGSAFIEASTFSGDVRLVRR